MTSEAETFQQVLEHVLGGTLSAAGYALVSTSMQQARGLFRYQKVLANELYVFIEFQTLYHPQSELSRFKVILLRNDGPDARQATPYYEEYDLAHVIWHEYETRLLPSDSQWWLYKQASDLAPLVLEAGQLLFGYGVPWLEDTL